MSRAFLLPRSQRRVAPVAMPSQTDVHARTSHAYMHVAGVYVKGGFFLPTA